MKEDSKMKKFQITDTEKHMTEIHHVEANTSEEALDLYCTKLAGSLEPVDSFYNPESEDEVKVSLDPV